MKWQSMEVDGDREYFAVVKGGAFQVFPSTKRGLWEAWYEKDRFPARQLGIVKGVQAAKELAEGYRPNMGYVRNNDRYETVMDLAHGDLDRVYMVGRYGGDVDLDEDTGFHYRALDHAKTWEEVEESPEDFVYLHPYLGYSDYSGGSVERANVKVIQENFEDEPGLYEALGGHGTVQLAVRLTNDNEDLIDVLAGLDDYIIIDEQAMSEVEMEAAEEQAESWGYDEFARDLEKEHGIDIEDSDSKGFRELFWSLVSEAGEAGEYPFMEEGGGIVFPFDDMKRSFDMEMLDKYGVEYEED